MQKSFLYNFSEQNFLQLEWIEGWITTLQQGEMM